ncbi:MAG: sensor histidine kinase [Lachnospiraceae bacterium]|nr:sensor histidine kinase [Lachnospiraceae bacterium]
MKRSFQTELFIRFFSIALITLIVSGIVLINAVQQKLEYDYEKKSNQELSEAAAALNGFLSEVEAVIVSVLDDGRVRNSINETDSWIIKKAYNQLYMLTESVREKAVFYIYDEKGNCILTTAESDPMEPVPVYFGILKTARTHPDEVSVKNGVYELNNDDTVICMARAITKDDSCIGYAACSIKSEDIKEILDSVGAQKNEMVILDDFFEELYSTDAAKESELAKRIHEEMFYKTQGSKEDAGFFIYDMEGRGLHLVIGKEDVLSDSLRRTMILVILVSAAAVLILSFLVSQIFSRRLMAPLREMTDAMSKVREGDLSIRMDSKRPDEFGQLSRDFDDMTKALKLYVELRSRQQKELSDSNIAMMQAQLNPHFLYNTLDSIKWIAKANHIPELATLSSSLAKILRASISADVFVPLSSELKLVENYVDIQKIRFSDSFSFDVELPMELEDCIVPKLILQPIVENAIVHGLKDRTDGYIFLNVYEKDKRLIIDVEDNGCGMDEEMLATLNERDREKLKGHIGFYNVDTIIRLHYGLNYGLHALNLKDGGVRITLELPIRYEKGQITVKEEEAEDGTENA